MRHSLLRRRAFTLIELLVVMAVIAILIALLVPAVQKVRFAAARTQSTNNLKQCALASHAYHDAWKYLPFNGVENATSTNNSSGSWGYQVLPYIDQQPIYDSQPANSSMANPVPALLCAMRGRPGYYTGVSSGGSGMVTIQQILITTYVEGNWNNGNYPGPVVNTITYTGGPPLTLPNPGPQYGYLIVVNASVTIQFFQVGPGQQPPGSSGGPNTYTAGWNFFFIPNDDGSYTYLVFSSPGSTPGAGPATDFAFNVFLNDPNGGINSADVNRQLATISDGASNTILLGHAYVQTSVYPSTTGAPPSLQPIFIGGSLATGRNTPGENATGWLQDGLTVTSNQWGSPMPGGGLMAMADGGVRIFPYATPLTNFLLPDDGNPVELP